MCTVQLHVLLLALVYAFMSSSTIIVTYMSFVLRKTSATRMLPSSRSCDIALPYGGQWVLRCCMLEQISMTGLVSLASIEKIFNEATSDLILHHNVTPCCTVMLQSFAPGFNASWLIAARDALGKVAAEMGKKWKHIVIVV